MLNRESDDDVLVNLDDLDNGKFADSLFADELDSAEDDEILKDLDIDMVDISKTNDADNKIISKSKNINRTKSMSSKAARVLIYGLPILLALCLLGIGIYLVKRSVDNINAENSDIQVVVDTINSETAVADNNIVTDEVPAEETISEKAIGADTAIKMRNLVDKLETIDMSILSEDERAMFVRISDNFDALLSDISNQSEDYVKSNLEQLNYQIDELLAIIQFRETESDVNELYGVELRSYDEIVNPDGTMNDLSIMQSESED